MKFRWLVIQMHFHCLTPFQIYSDALAKCVSVQDNYVVGKLCDSNNANQQWYRQNDFQWKNKNLNGCLDVVNGRLAHDKKLRLSICDPLLPGQNWNCTHNYVHVSGTNLNLNYGNSGKYAILSTGTGMWSEWKMLRTTANLYAQQNLRLRLSEYRLVITSPSATNC